jgi:hypothetical protein
MLKLSGRMETMNLTDLARTIGAVTVQADFTDRPVIGAYTSDLLSDVMGNAHGATVLITIQAHKNTVAVCSLAGISAIAVCNDREVPADMIEAAASEGIAIFVTPKNQYETSGIIYASLSDASGRFPSESADT